MRPTQRPEKPYDKDTILKRVREHFVMEGNPRCATSSESELGCFYGRTGCAVGCLITKEDAALIEGCGYVSSMRDKYPDIYNIYFGHDQTVHDLLKDLQFGHDYYPLRRLSTNDPFQKYISRTLDFIEASYCD
jgi:hypothetical protein